MMCKSETDPLSGTVWETYMSVRFACDFLSSGLVSRESVQAFDVGHAALEFWYKSGGDGCWEGHEKLRTIVC